jgi:hypothetical protein
MNTVYIAISLTHVKTEQEKDEVRAFLKWLEVTFDISILTWAFDVERWEAKPVDNIYDFDTDRVKSADLMIALYLSNDGSDGRGGEVINRVEVAKKPILAFSKQGVRVSRYPVDCLKKIGVGVIPFSTFDDMAMPIQEALNRIRYCGAV